MAIIAPCFTSPLHVQNFILHLDEIHDDLGHLQPCYFSLIHGYRADTAPSPLDFKRFRSFRYELPENRWAI